MSERTDSNASNWVDARVISLYSIDPGGIVPAVEPDSIRYSMFEFYEALHVDGVRGDKPLLDAYTQSHDHDDVRGDKPLLDTYTQSHDHLNAPERMANRQVLLAFADILKPGAENTSTGFSQKQIDSFWTDKTEPLLFMTLISVESAKKLDLTLQRIQEIYASKKYLVYYSLDCFDLIIFLKGRSFQGCADLIFELDYDQPHDKKSNDEKPNDEKAQSSDALLVDSITFYACDPDFDLDSLGSEEQESFEVFLRYSVTDASKMNAFYNMLLMPSDGEEIKIDKRWILGRYDVGFLNPNAHLKWLARLKDLAVPPADETPWYMIRTQSILIQPTGKAFQGHVTIHNPGSKLLRKRMADAYDAFRNAYVAACKKLDVPEETVWLRWLKAASDQAVSFWGNNMITDLGVCLVPQFLDFFAYAVKLWSSPDFLEKHRAVSETCFSVLFTNISILIDSMNQSSRQFIMTPSFHTVAFEMPPKIMAYYTAVTHRLIEAFHDDTPNQYGLTISPKFTRTLGVTSYAQPDVMKNDEFLSIGIGESALYRLQRTTVELAHELSHHVGMSMRNRPLRKRCILEAEIHNIMTDLAEGLYGGLVGHCDRMARGTSFTPPVPVPDRSELQIPWSMLRSHAERLLNALIRYAPQYDHSQSENDYSRDLLELLPRIPFYFYNYPPLDQLLFDFLWDALIVDKDGITALGQYLCYMAVHLDHIKCEDSGEFLPYEEKLRLLDVLVKPRVRSFYRKQLDEYKEDYWRKAEVDYRKPRHERLCNMFQEAYADLQAVLLFQLKLPQIRELFRVPGLKPHAMQLRVVPLAATLGPDTAEASEEDARLASLIQTELSHWDDNLVFELHKNHLDPVLMHALMRYLPQCRQDIEKWFSDNSNCVQPLRNIYEELSDQHGVYEMVTSLMNFIAKYRQDVQNEHAPSGPECS